MITTRKIKLICLCSTLLFFTSCMREAYYFSCKSIVVDQETLIPIPQSTIQSKCLFQQDIDNSCYNESAVKTDSIGNFEINFNKGYQVNLVINAKDYMESKFQYHPVYEQIPDTIYLTRNIIFETSTTITSPANLLHKEILH